MWQRWGMVVAGQRVKAVFRGALLLRLCRCFKSFLQIVLPRPTAVEADGWVGIADAEGRGVVREKWLFLAFVTS